MHDAKDKNDDRDERREAAPRPSSGTGLDGRALRAAAAAEASYLLSVRGR